MKIYRQTIFIFLCVTSSITFSQCLDSTIILVDADFELNDGGLIPDNAGDWEWGVIATALDEIICTDTHTPPPGASSGLWGWATNVNDCYLNSGTESTLVLNIDLSNANYHNTELRFMQWHDVFVNFDFMEVRVNGNVEFFNDTLRVSPDWYLTTIDLSQYQGGMVVIEFAMFATTVVNRSGWYLDDIAVTTCYTGVTGIDHRLGSKLLIAPNPVKNKLNCIWLGETLGDGLISILDLNGIVLQQEKVSAGKIHSFNLTVSDLRAGVYILNVELRGQMITKRFVKL